MVYLTLAFIMEGSLILRLLFLIATIYLSLPVLWSKHGLFDDPFHPYLAYRLLLLVTMVMQIPILIMQGVGFSEETYITILFTTISFTATMDILTYLAPHLMRIPTFNFIRGYHPKFCDFFLFMYVMGWFWRVFALSKDLLYGTYLAAQYEVVAIGNLVGILNSLNLTSLFGFVIFNKSRKQSFLVYLMILLELIWGIISGSKAAIIYVFLPLIFIYFHKSRISLRWIVVVLLCLSLVFLFPLISNYRLLVQMQVAKGENLSFRTIVKSIGAIFNYKNSKILLGNSITIANSSEIIERLSWAKFYGALLERPDLIQNKWYGKSYLPIFVWWIPRALWSDKPLVSVGAWYGWKVLGWSYNSRSEGAITIWGDAVMNFGFFGLIFVQFVWILLAFFLYRLGLSLGGWGLLFLASVYMRLLGGLEQNVAVPLVAFQQTALIVLTLRILARIFVSFIHILPKSIVKEVDRNI